MWITFLFIHKFHFCHCAYMDINRFIHAFYISFPQKMMVKRYKLINFAPKLESVDKLLR